MNSLRPFKSRIWLHVAFWGAWIGLWGNALSTEMPVLQAAYNAFALAAVYAVFVYVNLRFAIPRFLLTGKYAWYAGFLVFLIPATGLAIWETSRLLGLPSAFDNPEPRVGLLSATVNGVFMLFLTSSLKMVLHSLEQQQQNRQLENQQLQTELNFLKSQVNPHFLFNTLNNLYSLTLTKSDRAPEIVLKLSAILRYMLYECNERMVFLNKEIEYLQNYIELEEIRQDSSNVIRLRVTGSTDRKTIAPLLFTPLLENAIKHGLNRTTGDAWVEMKLHVEGMELEFNIVNSKSSSKPTFQSVASSGGSIPSGGIGLLNVKRRLDLVYPNRHVFSIVEGQDTYAVTLKLTLAE
jgi:two-component system, LytTR family, sensor kinase